MAAAADVSARLVIHLCVHPAVWAACRAGAWPGAGIAGDFGRRAQGSLATLAGMACLFHVTSAVNRESILAHGLDWTRMGAAPGIAGSPVPEDDGVFLCRDEFEAGFSCR